MKDWQRWVSWLWEVCLTLSFLEIGNWLAFHGRKKIFAVAVSRLILKFNISAAETGIPVLKFRKTSNALMAKKKKKNGLCFCLINKATGSFDEKCYVLLCLGQVFKNYLRRWNPKLCEPPYYSQKPKTKDFLCNGKYCGLVNKRTVVWRALCLIKLLQELISPLTFGES